VAKSSSSHLLKIKKVQGFLCDLVIPSNSDCFNACKLKSCIGSQKREIARQVSEVNDRKAKE
jgi:hypothetical protein